ncbi:hypothetical protein GF420_15770 [candidate division GN15 bacterium]|nr:hypothetical protein [candidate division GN15 bacterium]
MKVHFPDRLSEIMEPEDAERLLGYMEDLSILQREEEDLTLGDLDKANHHPYLRVHRRWETTVDRILDLCMEAMEGAYDVEAIRREDYTVNRYYYGIVALYVNVGDPYTTTVIFDTEEEEFYICGYGDWVESYQ